MGTLSGGALAGMLVALLVVSTHQSNGAELAVPAAKIAPVAPAVQTTAPSAAR